jgi:hypothetical protein
MTTPNIPIGASSESANSGHPKSASFDCGKTDARLSCGPVNRMSTCGNSIGERSVDSLFTYSVDADNRITAVSDSWLNFAIANGETGLKRENVIGTRLADWIIHDETRHLYLCLLEKVRAEQQALTVSYCCDAPALRRFMRLWISPGDAKAINFVSELIREEERPVPALLDAARPKESDKLQMCSWCKKICVGENQWQEVEDAVDALGLFEAPSVPDISHTICPDCHDAVIATMS